MSLCIWDKQKMVAIDALMRKLVRWYYGVLKTRTAFCNENLSPFLSSRIICLTLSVLSYDSCTIKFVTVCLSVMNKKPCRRIPQDLCLLKTVAV